MNPEDHEAIRQATQKLLNLATTRGYTTASTVHPTAYGLSAYIEVWREGCKRGIRLSDHPVGEFRQATDEHPTLLWDSSLTAEQIFDAWLRITDVEILAHRKAIAKAQLLEASHASAALEEEQRRKNNLSRAACYNERLHAVRSRFFRRFVYPSLKPETKTQEQRLVKAFNKMYRSRKAEI